MTPDQIHTLKQSLSATDQKTGIRVSYWPSGKSLEKNGYLIKAGRLKNMRYFITQKGRDFLRTLEDKGE